MSLNDFLMSIHGKNDSKLGYTTTVKEQVEGIQTTIDHFKKCLQTQKKQQGELQFQLKKLEEHTQTQFMEMHKEISDRVGYLTELFKGDSMAQNKQFEYLELQNTILHDQHDKLNQLSNGVMGRTQGVENNVGL